jgi:hypothetical protein
MWMRCWGAPALCEPAGPCRLQNLHEFAATREALRLPRGRSDWFGRIISIDGELDRPQQYFAQVANTPGCTCQHGYPLAESPEESRHAGAPAGGAKGSGLRATTRRSPLSRYASSR